MGDIFILVLALCTDTFVSGIAYGANRVHVSWGKMAAASGIGSTVLGLSLVFGGVLNELLPKGLAEKAACFLFLLLGVIKLLDYTIKKYINSHINVHKDLSFSISGLSIIINIYGNPLAADWDHSKALSWKETVMFSLAMSIDSLVAGTLSGFLKMPILLTTGLSMLLGIVAMEAGLFLGGRLASQKGWDLSWASGILFLILACFRL